MNIIRSKLSFDKQVFVALGVSWFFVLACCVVAAQAAEENIGWVTISNGKEASLTRDKKTSAAISGTQVFLNDEVATGKGSSVTIQFLDNSVITLAENGKIKITKWIYNAEEKKNSVRIKMANGKMRGLLNSLSEEGSEMSVETESVVAGIKGSEMSVWNDGESTTIAVHEGTGFVTSLNEKIKETQIVKAGYMLTATAGKILMGPIVITEAIAKELNKLIIIRKDDLIKLFKSGAKIVGDGAEVVVDGTKQAAEYTLDGARVTGTLAQKGVEGAVDLTKKGVDGAIDVSGRAANGTIKHSKGFFGWLADKLFFWRKKTASIEENQGALPEQNKE